MMDSKVETIDLLELQRRLKEGLEEAFPEKLWVKAEIASISVKANGHCYLDLCQNDEDGTVAKVKAMIWHNKYVVLSKYFEAATGSALKAGISVLFKVQVNYSELYGLSLMVDDLDAEFTLGQAELTRRKTIEALKEDGLMDLQKELAFPELPYSLAVVSARDAAGYGDFCHHLLDNEYGFKFNVELFEATMQGEAAPQSVADALAAIETCGNNYDAVLIMRGGGSNLDLACFDDYSMCFAIANCGIPVFTAIGHDRDVHVADMVAYDSVKTPTALADLMIDCYAAEDERISSYCHRLRLAFGAKLSAMEAKVDLLESRIKGADPRNILSRGYTLVADSKGVVVKSAKTLKKGDQITVYLSDGQAKAEIL